MKDHFYIVTVTCETSEEADKVITECFSSEEDYGFEYSINWDYSHDDNPSEWQEWSFEDDCSVCDEPMQWDSMELIWYCPNTWEHG